MPQMLGESVLPDSVNSRRRQVRERVQSLREPVRSTREDVVPGPDVVGKLESQLMTARDRFAQRDGMLQGRDLGSRLMELRGSDSGNDGGSGNSDNSGGSDSEDSSSRGSSATETITT